MCILSLLLLFFIIITALVKYAIDMNSGWVSVFWTTWRNTEVCQNVSSSTIYHLSPKPAKKIFPLNTEPATAQTPRKHTVPCDTNPTMEKKH